MGACYSKSIPPINVSKVYRGKSYVFLEKKAFKLIKIILPGTRSLQLNRRY